MHGGIDIGNNCRLDCQIQPVFVGKIMKNYLENEKTLLAFNIWDINSAKAVLDGACAQRKNVILQTSSSLYKKLPQKQLREFVDSYARQCGVKAWLHLDHCRELDIIEDAIGNKWDSVMIDASAKVIDENIALTNRVTEMAHKCGILVESEVGQVQGCEEDIQVQREAIASKEDIQKFLKETNVDMIAVAFGNAHGLYQGEPDLHYELVEYTTQHTRVPFVVHGGSGLSEDVIKRLLSISGVKKINISTEVKMSYLNGIKRASEQGLFKEDGFQAARVEQCIQSAIQEFVVQKLQLLDA